MRKRIKSYLSGLKMQFEDDIRDLDFSVIMKFLGDYESERLFVAQQIELKKRFISLKISIVQSVLNWI